MKPANSFELLCVFQRIRRAHPDTADTMNFLIDLLEEGDVGYSIDRALAAGSRRAKTAQPVECEASQSGDAKQRNAQPPSDRIEQLNQGGSK